jgi:hypothetical protein
MLARVLANPVDAQVPGKFEGRMRNFASVEQAIGLEHLIAWI